jgi:peptidoglycan/LPS O-acetylase OafA/YrhL
VTVTSSYKPVIAYRPEVDGLRAVAVLSVILFHAGFELFSGGFVGVDVFFVISGYLITSIILRELSQGTFSIVKFYERRARRILPALFFVIACVLPFAYLWLLPHELARFGESLVAVATFASNIFFWRGTDYFSPNAENELLLHTWSLAVEEQYYLLFPLLLMVSWRFYTRKLFWCVAIVALMSFAVCELGWRNSPIANFYLLPTRAWELLLGSLVAIRLASSPTPLAIPSLGREFIVGAGLIAIVASTLLFDESTPFPSYYAAIPTLGAALIIAFGNGQQLTTRFLSLKPIVFIGLISYSAYLWHHPLFTFLRLRGFGELTELHFLGAAVASLLLAAFTWRFVETPFRKTSTVANGRLGVSRQAIFGLSAAGLGAAFVVGIAVPRLGVGHDGAGELARDGLPPGCLRMTSIDARNCAVVAQQGLNSRTIALWGDSVADSFSTSLVARAKADSVAVHPLIFHSCPALLGTIRNEAYRQGRKFAQRCADYTEAAKTLIEELHPDVVVLANAYEMYASGTNPYNGEPILLSQDSAAKSALTVVLDGLEATVAFLNSKKIEVVLVMPYPTTSGADFSRMRRMAMLDRLDADARSLNSQVAQHLGAEILARLNSKKLKFRTVSPATHLCKEAVTLSDCSAVDGDGNYLSYDGTHFSLFLARLFADDVLSATAATSRESAIPVKLLRPDSGQQP